MTPAEQARAEWERETSPYPQFNKSSGYQENFRRYGDAIALLEWQQTYFIITKLETLNSGSGAGTRLLLFLKGIADRYKLRIFGNPVAYVPSTPEAAQSALTHDQLSFWYAKYGFIVATSLTAPGLPILWYPDLPQT